MSVSILRLSRDFYHFLSSSLSELLYLSLPTLPTMSQKSDSIQIGTNTGVHTSDDGDGDYSLSTSGKWEDEEERKFFEDIQDLKDFVPKSVLGIEEGDGEKQSEDDEEKQKLEKIQAEEETRKLEEELEGLKMRQGRDSSPPVNGNAVKAREHDGASDEDE